jgi:hypothetical protein
VRAWAPVKRLADNPAAQEDEAVGAEKIA